jgi:hypothetical protein
VTYEYRSSDLDFAEFLSRVDPIKVGRERWIGRSVPATTFARMKTAVENQVSPELVQHNDLARHMRRPRNRYAGNPAETSNT